MLKKVFGIGLLAVLAACADEEITKQPNTPLPTIDVSKVIYEPVQSWFTFTTRLQAPEKVSLMPRVSGVIETVEFKDGQSVNKGDLLVTLDDRTFKAQVSRLEAQVKSARAALEQAANEQKRAAQLVKRKAISAEQAEARDTAVKQRSAELMALRAQLESAKLDLEFTKIYAPISGTISRAFITKGNNVNANQSVISNIVSNDQVYAYFDVDERTWNRYFSTINADSNLPTRLELSGQNGQEFFGRVDFVDNSINENTGTLQVRAVFDATKSNLKVGSFGRVQISTTKPVERVLVPERSIGTDLENRFVLTLNEENTLQYSIVTLGERYGTFRAIENGLNADSIIAVNGPAKVGPNSKITPKNVTLDISNTSLIMASNSTSLPNKRLAQD
ncbi:MULTISPECIES: efflux RND transporter periplasmic adaptor subunit [Vibrio]|uniref:efflux RND transporter periplasmic adaptor subunit n=1 Tax=Vibrio TaxID=662 RepID=UPI001A8F73B8|nr:MULTISPECIES: efflux RND transporter periplasmic adaptor subunit [Vibrio]MBO0210505.1 efflux RND transporter periplasmic adaptor subunit [Vibrio sp. Vb0877]MCG6325774.1 efflux RND transporter periplasmic adaptor subunit [Vibrio alginolyticus]MCR9539143.1 efflux RND transporter periplasmic adaptor subunit [Vibrio alginolyticus]MCS0177742.1 efflux RND transporter periplasmic adaptor subunit [Vibrio alginolyticus]HCZ9276617.1 efflux RND transporter periplasmic adaptor subunit [Vibrio alginolyt